MRNLIKAEFFKLRKLTAYKVLLIIYLMIEIVINKNYIGNSVAYPKYNPTYTGIDWLLTQPRTMLFYMLAVFFFTNIYVNGDFVSHTFYSGLLCGLPRKKAFWAKIISLFAGIVPLMLVYALTGTVLWSVHAGFGMDFGVDAAFLIAKAFGERFLLTLQLVGDAVLFAVIVRSRIGAFLLSLGTLNVIGIFRANIENIIKIPALSKILLFLLSLLTLNIGTFLAGILLRLLTARYIFEKFDLK